MPRKLKSWPKLEMEVPAPLDDKTGELAGEIAQICGALGGAEEQDEAGRPKWALFFHPDVNREDVERCLADEIPRLEGEYPGIWALRWRWGDIADQDWALKWRQHFHAFDIPPWFRITPPWEAENKGEQELRRIIINPGQGFGIGTHETTRLCMEALGESVRKSGRVLDVGAGSGILSIAAAKLGARYVVGVEIDGAAVENARDNIQRNKVADCVQILEGGPEAVAGQTFDTIVCNMLLTHSRPLIPLLPPLLAPQGILIISGIMQDEAPEVKDMITNTDGSFMSGKTMGEWGTVIWKRPK